MGQSSVHGCAFESYDAIVIGGGFFGCSVADFLKQKFKKQGKECRILVLERASECLTRASYANQARVHSGYHYPRHFLTAVRSRINFPRFISDYESCIDSSFEHYYAVGRQFSKTNAHQFKNFFKRVGAPLKKVPEQVSSLFNPHLIEEVFKVEEVVFNAVKLAELVVSKLKEQKVELCFNATVRRLRKKGAGDQISVEYAMGDGSVGVVESSRVYNCTYSQINDILNQSEVELIPLKHEIAEMCLVEVPPALKNFGVTVMCGPFFSCMPFPSKKLHTLSHVRYTPHCYWYDDQKTFFSPYEYINSFKKETHFPSMVRDATRFLPALFETSYVDSLWEVKTTLPNSESNDGRPILFRPNHGMRGLTCIMGGKIDNIYDIQDEIDRNEGEFELQ